jgi:archaellum component FlaC
MANNTISKLSNEALFKTSVFNLKQSLLELSSTQRRVASRVKTLIRSVMIGIVTTLVFILYLVYILTQQVNALSNSLNNVSKQAILVQESIDDIEMVMINFETYMNELPGIDVSVTNLEYNITNITHKFSALTNNVTTITSEIKTLNNSLSGLGQNTLVLNQVLRQVTKDVADGAKPIRQFNHVNPFNFFR